MNSILSDAPYDSVYTVAIISDIKRLLELGQSPLGTGSTSITVEREKTGVGNLLLLEGLGKELWQGIDVQKYINELREEWEK